MSRASSRCTSAIPSSSMSTSAPHRAAPKPSRTMPASHYLAKTPPPKNVYEQISRYPSHPLLSFFQQDKRKVKVENPGKEEEETEVAVPVSIKLSDLSKDNNSRAWLAPELRQKSSLELHQLWYWCLTDRNRLATTRDELTRTGARSLALMANLNIGRIDRRIRKTMARTKFVLNERRLALMDAQKKALEGVAAEEVSPHSRQADLFEEGEDVEDPITKSERDEGALKSS